MNKIERGINRDDLKNATLSTSMQIMKSKGWRFLSAKKMAEVLGPDVSEPTDSFSAIEGSYFQLVNDGLELLLRQLKEAKERHETADQQIREMANTYLRFAFCHKEYYQSMLRYELNHHVKYGSVRSLQAVFREPIITILGEHGHHDSDIIHLKIESTLAVLQAVVVTIKGRSNADECDIFDKMIFNDVIAGCVRNLRS